VNCCDKAQVSWSLLIPRVPIDYSLLEVLRDNALALDTSLDTVRSRMDKALTKGAFNSEVRSFDYQGMVTWETPIQLYRTSTQSLTGRRLSKGRCFELCLDDKVRLSVRKGADDTKPTFIPASPQRLEEKCMDVSSWEAFWLCTKLTTSISWNPGGLGLKVDPRPDWGYCVQLSCHRSDRIALVLTVTTVVKGTSPVGCSEKVSDEVEIPGNEPPDDVFLVSNRKTNMNFDQI
jgi:hypothetical protein